MLRFLFATLLCLSTLSVAHTAAAFEQVDQTGFPAVTDKRYIKVKTSKKSKPKLNYKTLSATGDPANPESCIWRFKHFKNETVTIAASMKVNWLIEDGKTKKKNTVFHLKAYEGVSRMNLAGASIVTKSPMAKTINSGHYISKLRRGRDYEIQMPFHAYLPFVTGIHENGLTINVTHQDIRIGNYRFNTSTKTLPPPHPQAYATYYKCIAALVKAGEQIELPEPEPEPEPETKSEPVSESEPELEAEQE